MKVLVAYYSETGNTEKIAKAIYDEVSMRRRADLKRVEEITADIFNDYDFVFLGSACHSSDLANPAKRILSSVSDSPNFKLAGFFTHATYPAANHNKDRNLLFNKWAAKCITSLHEVSKEKQIDYKGYFNCQGAPSPPLQEFIRREIVTAPDAWEEYIEEVMKHPTPEDLEKAKEFARKTLLQT